jgi:hypothetical protein
MVKRYNKIASGHDTSRGTVTTTLITISFIIAVALFPVGCLYSLFGLDSEFLTVSILSLLAGLILERITRT